MEPGIINHHLEFERGLLEDLPEEVEAELLAVEHVQTLVTLDVIQTQLKLGLDLIQAWAFRTKAQITYDCIDFCNPTKNFIL